jgi:putative membrane protein
MSYLLQFLATAVALYFAAKYIPDISYTSSSALLVFVVVLAIANLTLGTVLRIITFPVKLLTLGNSSL